MIRVVCTLWHDPDYRWNGLFRYGAVHVNTLRSMVRRHLKMPHEFVCITDQPDGIDPDIRVVPIWNDLAGMGGCYRRLKLFAPEMREVIGERFVAMDLDCVVTGPLDPLLDRPEDFVIWANGIGPTPYCGSMFMMTAGARREVWREFDPATSPAAARTLGYVGTDQAWIAARLPGEATWTLRDGILSYRRFSGRRLHGRAMRRRLFQALPSMARLVYFHGPFDPSQEQLQQIHPWIAEHWR